MSKVSGFFDKLQKARLSNLKRQTAYKGKRLAEKEKIHRNPNSLLWVWEFSKKAVLICFMFYIIIQIYSMVVMVKYMDFSYLGTLIDSAKELTRDCVFGYLIKAGLENIGKIWFNNFCSSKDSDEPVG